MIKFKLVQELPYNQFIRISNENKPLYLGTPFLGGVKNDSTNKVILNNKILIDSNIFSDLRKNKNKKNINAFMFEAFKMKAEISHIFAASELFINHKTPEFVMDEYYKSLQSNFNLSVPLSDRSSFINLVKNNINNINKNMVLLRDWLVIAKYIYNRKNGLKKHVIEFSGMIKYNHLPIFSFIYHVILVFFHVKENKKLYDNDFFNKIQSDMAYRNTLSEEIDCLNNVAKDIALFIAAIEIFYCFEDSVNDFSWIASSDSTIGLILQEVCIAEIESKDMLSKNGIRFTQNKAKIGLRPNGKSYEQLSSLIQRFPPEEQKNSLTREDSMKIKKHRLHIFSGILLKAKYDELTKKLKKTS